MAKRKMPVLQAVLLCVALVVLLLLLAVFLLQRRLIYIPQFPQGSRAQVWAPSLFGMASYEEVDLRSEDGTLLKCLYIPSAHKPADDPAVLWMHGNAGNIGHRLPLVKMLRQAARDRVSVLMLSYRGYGLSEGSPHQDGMCMDARAALEWLTAKTPAAPVVVYGQSIGGAVAFDLVAGQRERVRGLVVENTFSSLGELVPHIIPLLGWASFMLFDTWKSSERALKIAVHNSAYADGRDRRSEESNVRLRTAKPQPHSGPEDTPPPAHPVRVLMLSGAKDELIPPAHMQRLHKTIARGGSEFVSLEVFPNGDHNATCEEEGYFEKLAAFLDSLAQQTKR